MSFPIPIKLWNNTKRTLKREKLHINWIPFGDINMGSSRTNVWDVHDELMSMNSVISTVNGEEWNKYDVVIFQKIYDKKLFNYVKKRCLLGFSVGDTHMIFEKAIRSADFVLCSCPALKQEVQFMNKNCHVILEGEKMDRFNITKKIVDSSKITLIYHGFKENLSHLAGNVADAVNSLRINKKISVKLISNFQNIVTIPYFNVPLELCHWNLDTFNQDVLTGDIGIIPQGDEPQFRLKSANKIRTLMAMKTPVIGDKRNQDFRETLGDNRYGLLAHSKQEWKEALEMLINNFDQRLFYAIAGYQRVAEHYTTSIAAMLLIEVIRGYFSAK